tara:strand:+ start:147 stop:1058 length:912 start_codon:yes stop_codon:yes gene_type:complete
MKFDFLSESDQAYFIHKASTLVEALPFIREHSGDIVVIKYGGHAMGDPKLAKSFARDIGLIKEVGIYPIVVHGGGPQIADKLKSKNITSKFVDGLRVTDIDTVRIVEDVLANEINTEIVNAINDSGGKAIGLTGNKNNLLSATKLKLEIKDSDSNIEKLLDIGFVGQPTDVNTNLIKEHINYGDIPVIAPLGIDAEGNSYNINADTAAGFIAGKLKASKLLLLTDVAGILDKDKKLIPFLKLEEAITIIKEEFVSGGMKPKIKTCIDAMHNGVTKTTILDGRIPHSLVLELFTEHGIGTQIYS